MGSRDELVVSPLDTDDIAKPDPVAHASSRSTTLVPAASNASVVVIGELIAITGGGCVPLVVYPGQAGPVALRARTVVDLFAAHVGYEVVLMFDDGDMARPIVMGVLRTNVDALLAEQPGHVEVQSGGDRLIVSAKAQLVLRCGKARLVLNSDGRIEIKGEEIVSEATGPNFIRGGSVQLN